MGAPDYFAAYNGARQLVSELLGYSQAEDWDAFTAELPRYVVCMTQLPAVESLHLTLEQQQQLAETLKELKVLQDELVLRSESRKGVLVGELQSLHNTDKLGKAYR